LEPTSTVISIDGIQATGRHGANPGEQLEPQEFVVDVEIWVEVTSDTLEGTLDYRVIIDRVRGAVSGSSFVLLEALAEAVASDLMDFFQVLRVVATVHKPRAAESLGVDDISAEVTLEV
jgi:dihydroneopterin aldolase